MLILLPVFLNKKKEKENYGRYCVFTAEMVIFFLVCNNVLLFFLLIIPFCLGNKKPD